MKSIAKGYGRREFLESAGLAAAAMATGGCMSGTRLSGGAMSGFVAPRLERIRVGVVGVG